jgi:hypothetical protein
LGLFDEAMQQDHVPFRNAENYASHAIPGKRRADFPQPAAECSTQRHSDGPSELDDTDIETERPSIRRE